MKLKTYIVSLVHNVYIDQMVLLIVYKDNTAIEKRHIRKCLWCSSEELIVLCFFKTLLIFSENLLSINCGYINLVSRK